MKSLLNTIILVLLVTCNPILLNAASGTASGKSSLSGMVTDKFTQQPLPGVYLYFTDLKTGGVTDANGNYLIENLPKTTETIQVSFIGYKLVIESIDLSLVTKRNFVLEEAATEISEVIVTGQSKAAEQNRTPIPVTIIPQIQLLQNAGSNIIEAVSHQPGIHQITTGPGISKPVIRGLGYNRVVVLNDGVRQEGQQWGDEHGVEVDEFSVNRIEILKGPASLAYGSDALAGVINFISAPTVPEGIVKGNILTNYQSNNGLIAYSASIQGNKKGLIWDMRYSNKMAHCYHNTYDGYVLNTGFRENAFNGTLGLNRSWGYSHLILGAYNFRPGIAEGERDSVTGNFLKPIAKNDGTEGIAPAGDSDFTSYTPGIPYQTINHYRIVSNSSFILGNTTLKSIIGFQQNKRKEFASVLEPETYGLYFLLNTLSYDIKVNLPEKNGYDASIGVNGMMQSSENKGQEVLIPEYSLFDAGVYSIVKKTLGRFDLSGGIRYDMRTIDSRELIETSAPDNRKSAAEAGIRFTAFKKNLKSLTGSMGFTCRITPEVYTKLNFSRGFRAPNISELGSNGAHEGTIRYETGNSELEPEYSLQADYALGFNTHHVAMEVDVFYNTISNYIFLQKLNTATGADSLTQGFSTFKFVSGDARMYGGEARLDIHPHPLDWLHFENTFSFVSATRPDMPDSMKYLPMIPAARIKSELRFDVAKTGTVFMNSYLELGIDHYFAQNHVYAAFGTETATPAYTLASVGIGTDLVYHKKPLCSIYISGQNLFDVAYQSHLSRLKYAPVNYATGRTGIFNAGRNISVKILIPLSIQAR
jgi:iron complex outermembrane receptor protein